MAKPNKSSGRIRTFVLTCDVTHVLEGTLSDWPPNIQDGIMAALEKKAAEIQLPLALIGAECVIDYGETAEKDKPFVRIFASEIVAKDTGYDARVIEAEKALIEAGLGKIH